MLLSALERRSECLRGYRQAIPRPYTRPVSTGLVIAVAALLVVLLVAGLVSVSRAGRPAREHSAQRRREQAIETQILVEEHDIGEMIEARNEIRRRRGKPAIGEELGERALRPGDEE
jgi:hypothetical protein